MDVKITKEEMDMVVATGKMLDLGLYAEEIAAILKQPDDMVVKWVWFHKMNKTIESEPS